MKITPNAIQADGSAQIFTEAINTLPFGCAMLDPDERVIFANPTILKLLALDENPQFFENISGRFATFDFASFYENTIASRMLADAGCVPYGEKSLHVYVIPIMHGQQSAGGMIILEDSTKEKTTEKQKEEFFAVASHELRTPLVAIRDNAELMIQHYYNQLPNKDMQEMMVDIDKASTRLIGIVNMFLDISKMENGKVNFTQEQFSMSTLIDEVVVDLRDVAQKKGIHLSVITGTILPNVFADRNRAEQVLINLIGNAIKYTEHGSVIVSSSIEADMVVVKISDTGPGIALDFQSHLFQKFEQANGVELAKHISNSTGLGLYISQLFTDGMHGKIYLEKSELGKGSVFVFALPIAR